MHKYIYFFNYNSNETAICKLESRQLFNEEEKNKLLFSDIEIDPSWSAFIKKRLDIISTSEDYPTLIEKIKKEQIQIDGFKAIYIHLEGDPTQYRERLSKLKDIGYCIEGDPDYKNPTTLFAICFYKGLWYFGQLINNSFDWHKHNTKPHSFSSSLSASISKVLVNAASNGNIEKKLIDACCGVGTVMLEACFAGINIEGCDISWKICQQARKNIAHFNYNTVVYRSDIKDITKRYDAAIIDLPYNISIHVDEEGIYHIIQSAAAITDRLLIVSTTDISNVIKDIGYQISDSCSINKIGKTNFVRKIWVCDRINP
jgi:tRNA G10  N-methylase Trm11